MGNVTAYTNGEFETFTNTWNTAGRLTAVTSSRSDSNNPPNLMSGAHYNAFGVITSDTLGNGETESWTYNDKRGRLAAYSAILSGTTIYSLTIPNGGYAPNSDILAANDSVNGNWTYSYDQFNRLVGSNKNSGSAVFSYVYDRFGNRWQQNGPNSFVATFTGNNPGNPQNNNRVDGYSYDASGNMLSDGTHTYAYDAENRITKVDNGNTATYVYDAFGRRVAKSTASPQNNECTTSSYGQVFYVYDLSDHYEVYTGTGVNGCIDEIYAGGRHLATYSQGDTIFSHSDWLGTERARRSYGSTTTQYCTSNPFGDALSCSPIGYESPLHFTGKLRDPESNLDNFGARFDSSDLGRFMSPDPVMVSWRRMVNPQIWNSYSYAGNNPLRFVDPTGEELVQLGQHTDDEIKKRKKEIGQELKNKDLTKEQKDALKKERNTLNLEQQGNQVVGNLLAKLDQNGQRNGLQLSNFTLSTDTKNDFASAATPEAMQKLLNDQAFVIRDNNQFSGTIYIRTEPETGFYQLSQRYSDFGYYGASALSHEQVHLVGGPNSGEYPAFQRQLTVFEGFQNFFQNPALYRGLDESIRDGIKANQPQ